MVNRTSIKGYVLGVVSGLLTLACAGVGLAEMKRLPPTPTLNEGFSVVAPNMEVQEEGRLGLNFNHGLRNASITDMRVEAAGLTLAKGQPITSFDVDKDLGIVVGVGSAISEVGVTSVKALPDDGLEVLAMFQKDRQPVTPMAGQVAVFDLETLKPLKWSMSKKAGVGKKGLAAYVLVDGSSSMNAVSDILLRSAKEFFLAMPDGVMCSLSWFDDKLYHITPKPEMCKFAAVRTTNIRMSGGTTELFGSLQETYLKAVEDGYSHTLIIILSDGQHVGDGSKADALTAKARVSGQTLVLWLGNVNKTDLTGIFDMELAAGSDIKAGVKNYFKNLTTFVKGQKLLKVKR